MSTYTPDRWIILELSQGDDVIRKVFGGWGGSYTYSSSWKLSSGIVSEEEFEDRYEFKNHSGSLYICRKNSYGLSGYMTQVLHSFEDEVIMSNGEFKLTRVEGYDNGNLSNLV